MMYNLGVYKHTIVTVAERLKRDISLKKNGTKGYISGSLLWGNFKNFSVTQKKKKKKKNQRHTWKKK